MQTINLDLTHILKAFTLLVPLVKEPSKSNNSFMICRGALAMMQAARHLLEMLPKQHQMAWTLCARLTKELQGMHLCQRYIVTSTPRIESCHGVHHSSENDNNHTRHTFVQPLFLHLVPFK